MATDIAAELTQRVPQSGSFLEIAVLRAEACFLQEYQLNPVRSLQLTKCVGEVALTLHPEKTRLLELAASRHRTECEGDWENR